MTKVAVIGGGPAGLATAWHLVNADPTAQVTVYQQGWRLGGKGASSRGPAGRIEEHGIHLFGNFYANALNMMQAVYDELDRVFDHEFLPNNLHLSLHARSGRRFSLRVADVSSPTQALQADNINPRLLIKKMIESAVEALIGMTEIPAGPPTRRQILCAGIRRRISQRFTDNVVSRRTARYERSIAESNVDPGSDIPLYVEAIKAILPFRFAVHLAWCWSWRARGAIRYTTLDLLFTTLRGIVEDDLFVQGIDAIDDKDHLAWLEGHGASKRTLASPVARTVANICFQYSDGDTEKDPDMSASGFVNFVLRQLAAPGPNFWYFRNGTGESVVLPLYDALRRPANGRQPVSFEFFTRVTDLIPSVDGPNIERVKLRRHARPADAEYDPIVRTDSRRFWPSEPILERIHPDDRDAVAGIADLEDWYELLEDEPGRDEELVRGTDFDVIVLATPPPTHEFTCPSLLAHHAAWQARVDDLPFIATQGVQLWFADAGSDIGLPGEPYRSEAERWSTAEWLAPNSCWVDFSDLVGEEDWPQPVPGSLFYFCGPLHLPQPVPKPGQGNPDYSARAKAELMTQLNGMLGEMKALLPGTMHNGSFRYDRLVDHDRDSKRTGPARLRSQHLRPNVVPSELYGVSKPGCLRRRPSPWESGFDNLVLAGDWVNTGLNINSFEAATISGALASYAVTGSPDPAAIVGYDFMRPGGGPRRPG